MSDLGERKHEATPERRKKFRQEGRFPRARDAGGLAATLAVVATLVGTSEQALRALERCYRDTLGDLSALTRGDGGMPRNAAIGALVTIAGPAAIAAAVGAATVGAAQAGIGFDLSNLTFKAERLDPLPRLKQLFAPGQSLAQTLLATLRVGVVAFIAYRTLRADVPTLLGLTTVTARVALRSLAAVSLDLLLKISAALVVLSAVDYAYSRFTLGRQMRMTSQELKEEQRSTDGDPRVKARIRARARALARRRMMAEVKRAAVVVTNPTHVAVALRYQATDAAPVVVAKGHDDVALRIRSEARAHGVPIIESRGLARALDAEVPIGRPIAGAHYAAVAHVLAFVYRLHKRRPRPPGAARRVPGPPV